MNKSTNAMNAAFFKQSSGTEKGVQEAIQILEGGKEVLTTFHPRNNTKVTMTVIKDSTEEAKQAFAENRVLYYVDEKNVRYLICR